MSMLGPSVKSATIRSRGNGAHVTHEARRTSRPPALISWEIPRLCRGGSRSLTFTAVCACVCASCSHEENQPLQSRPLTLRKGGFLTDCDRSRQSDQVSRNKGVFV